LAAASELPVPELRSSASTGTTLTVVDHLGDDVTVGTEDRETGPLGSAGDLAPHPAVSPFLQLVCA
jgi:hypothetical protein